MFDDLIGIPFDDHGYGPDSYNCYGLAMEVRRRMERPIPKFADIAATAFDQVGAAMAQQIASSSWVRIPLPAYGAVMAIKSHPVWVNHVGVYLEDGWFIHIQSGLQVHKSRISSPEWKRRIQGYYEYVG